MRRGCEIGDYIVAVGSTPLPNHKLYDDRLVVRLYDYDLGVYQRGDESAGCDDLYSVRVETILHSSKLL